MSNRKDMIIALIVRLIKKTLIKMSQCFPKLSNSHFGDSIKFKVDLPNYTTKTDLKNVTDVDTSSFPLKTNLANLKTEIDKLDIDKLKPLPDDVSKVSNVVTNKVVKKTAYNKLSAKANNIDASDFVLKLNITLTKQNYKIKFLILVVLLKKLIIILKLLN